MNSFYLQSMLSLAKLALLASDDLKEEIRDCVKRIDNELALIAHQEDLPTQLLTTYGYDVEKLRVFTPTELITVFFLIKKYIYIIFNIYIKYIIDTSD